MNYNAFVLLGTFLFFAFLIIAVAYREKPKDETKDEQGVVINYNNDISEIKEYLDTLSEENRKKIINEMLYEIRILYEINK